MRIPSRFRAETEYVKATGTKANVNPPMMAAVGNGDGATFRVAGRDNFYWVRLINDANRLTQCFSPVIALAYDDYIYVAKASDRKLTYYEFVSFIQAVGGETSPILNARGIIIPDNVAQGFYIEDDDSAAGGTPEYVRIVTTDGAQAVEWNFNNDDVNFIVNASALPDAINMDGATGAITLAGPSMQVPDDWWQGLGAAAGRWVFDSTPAPDQIVLTSADLNMAGNDIIIPDAQADAMHVIDDTTAINFQQFVTTAAAQATVFNIGEQDVDFRVAALTTIPGIDPTHAVSMDGATGHVGIGWSPQPDVHFYVYNPAITTIATYYGGWLFHQKTAGVTDEDDDLYGWASEVIMNQVGGVLGQIWGGYYIAFALAGDIGTVVEARDVVGILGRAQIDGATVYGEAIGGLLEVVVNTGNLEDDAGEGNAYGAQIRADVNAGTTVDGNVYGAHIWVDDDGGTAIAVYMLYLDEQTGVDYGIYQNGTAPNQLGGKLTLTSAELEFTAATGLNLIEFPDALANALYFADDTTAINFQQFITTAAGQAVVFNIGEQDVDFRVAAVGHTDALVVQGSDGQITLGALGAGVVQSTAGGVLSSSTLAADQLDMGIGDMLFNAADGLLLLNPDGKINDTEWWSLRKQLATLSGAFHQEAGRWLGTRGLVVEEATTNLIINPSIEVVTTGWTLWGSTITRDTTYSLFGDAALKVVTDNAGVNEGTYGLVTATTAASTEYTFSVYLRGSGNVRLGFWDTDGGFQLGSTFALSNVWTRYQLTKTFDTGAARRVYVTTELQQGITFYCDGFQLEQQDYATTYADGTLGTGYAWTGAAHGSTSTRTATTVNLDAHVGLISGNNTVSFRVVAQMPYDSDATWPEALYCFLQDLYGASSAHEIAIGYNPTLDKFWAYINGGWRLYSAAQTFKAGDWIDLILTCDFTADDYNLYINGVLEDNDTTALTAPVLTIWAVGCRRTYVEWWGGFNFAEYAAFDRVLTAIEVAGMYALQRPLIDAGSLDNPPVCNATVWNDIYFPMSSGKVGGANQPTWAAFQGNTFEYTFAINDYIHLPSQEIAHSYREGSDIPLHVHIVLDGSDVGDTDVNYEIEYTVGDVDEVMSAAALATSGDYTITGGTADRTHLRIEIGTITGATYKIMAALKIRFRRIALVGGGNAPGNDPFVLMVGAHIEEDTVGSRTEIAK